MAKYYNIYSDMINKFGSDSPGIDLIDSFFQACQDYAMQTYTRKRNSTEEEKKLNKVQETIRNLNEYIRQKNQSGTSTKIEFPLPASPQDINDFIMTMYQKGLKRKPR